MNIYKKCPKCCKVKKIENFTKSKKTKDGLYYCCKKCKREYDNIRYIKNKRNVINRARKYYIGNIGSIKKKQKKYYIDNVDSIRKYYIDNVDSIKKKHQKFIHGVSSYRTYSEILKQCGIECRRSPEDKNVLEVKCTYCNKWYRPKQYETYNKIRAIGGLIRGECNLYCSDYCKDNCPEYNQNKYPKDFKPATSREVQPALRKLVFHRDNWTCQKCWSQENLHCHHFTGVEQNPIESADIDNCITLCKTCHKEVHKLPGCGYYDFRRKKCE